MKKLFLILLMLAGVSHAQTVTVDFGTTTQPGSPAIFGGNRFPTTDTGLQQEEIAQGVTFSRNIVEIRGDGSNVPVSTNAAYAAAMARGCMAGSVCDPNTWTWTGVDLTQVAAAKAAGIPTELTINFAPAWNTYPGDYSGCSVPNSKSGVSANLSVYADIVKKVYAHVLPDQVVIYNEPDYALCLVGAQPYGDQLSAYVAMYKVAAAAIRTVSSTVPIGGPDICCSSPDGFIPGFLTSGIPAGNLNFVDYHNYYDANDELMAGFNVVSMVHAINPALPVYLTEWNADSTCPTGSSRTDNDSSTVSFMGMRLTNQIKEGLQQSDYWSLYGGGGCSFLSGGGTTDPLLKKTRTYLLMSKDLALGLGSFSVKSSSVSGVTAALGAVNSQGAAVAVLVNDSAAAPSVTLSFTNLGFSGTASLHIYQADYGTNDATAPTTTSNVSVSDGAYSQSISMPAYSVVGVTISATTIAGSRGPAVRVSAGPGVTSMAVTPGGDTYHASGRAQAVQLEVSRGGLVTPDGSEQEWHSGRLECDDDKDHF